MAFTDKYTTQQILDADPTISSNKIVISPDAYAIGEMLENLINIMGRR